MARPTEADTDPGVAPALVHPDEEIEGAGIQQIRLLIHEGHCEQALACL